MSSGNPIPQPSPPPTPRASSIQPDQTLEASAITSAAVGYTPISHLPIDLFVQKRHQDLKRGELTFTDSSGNLVFRVDGNCSKSTPRPRRLLLDDSGNPIFSIFPCDGRWQGFKGESEECKDLVFRVQRTYFSLLTTELEVFLLDENWGGSTSDFKIRGCPFQRSSTIYKGNSIIAETSLLYKLRKVIVGRRRFKLTIFPGFVDHALIAALVVIYFDGRK
ncbi:protein LURP-one-related 7 [Telopea speciosissima]|uniref:protein LURP-one-related 7 n=1 Tax=Telopea speciosissima TaxID=54955 RepID=UPI001CC47E9E|nr:protein LURP-one-related 7 [Telopea speciosissima]